MKEKLEFFDLNELQKRYPEAYEGLPEPYKGDSCLEFFVFKPHPSYGELFCAQAKEDQLDALGAEVWFFWREEDCWWTSKVLINSHVEE